MIMEIAKLTERDLDALSALFRQFWDEESRLDRMQSTFARLAGNPAYILLSAKHNDRLVGFAMGIICEELYGECKPFMIIEDLIVDNNLRRGGIGSALMRELEKAAIEHGCCQIIFVTESNRTEAHRFYESFGYGNNSCKGFKKRLPNKIK